MLRSAATLSASGPGTYHHHDGLGSVIMLTNAGGSVVERYRYDVFGHVTILDATHAPRAATAHNNRFLFTGREWIGEIGIYDYRNRIYSPALGRFLQTDPIRFDAGDVNLYRYVANNPVNWTDSTGHAIDTFVDLVLILNDLYNIFTDPCNKYDHLVSLSLNSAGLFLPFATGLGATYKAAKAAKTTLGRQTTILGENMRDRVIPFANQTGSRHLPFGATRAEWDAMTPRQRWKLNDGTLRARINEGDNFLYIGTDPGRPMAERLRFDLTGSELLRLRDRGIPYQTVSPQDVMSVIGRP